MAPNCKGYTKKGRRCEKQTTHESGFCTWHQAGVNPTGGNNKNDRPQNGPVANYENSRATAVNLDATPISNQGPAMSKPISSSMDSAPSSFAEERWNSMSHELLNRAFILDKLIDEFTCHTPSIDSKDLKTFKDSQPWNKLVQTFETKSLGKSETEFKNVLICFGKLPIVRYLSKPISTADKSRWNKVRISVQGAIPMKTWDLSAKWVEKFGGSTPESRELKPDLMSLVVEETLDSPQLDKYNIVCVSQPETISPPPKKRTNKSKEESNEMQDHQFPIVGCRYPVWEIADILWELKRGDSHIDDSTTYLDCALKASEVLRYQWSRRFVYYFLHCGKFMRLLRFDRAGLVVSKIINIIDETEVFLCCLLAVFLNKPSELGYPCTKDLLHDVTAPVKTHQDVIVDSNLLRLDEQIAGPFKDHLVGRGTVAWKAHLLSDNPEKDGKVFCVKASWAEMKRDPEGQHIKKLHDAGIENVVKLLAFSPEKKGEGNTTQLGSEQLEPLKGIGNYRKGCQNKMSNLSRDNETAEHCQGTPTATDTNQETVNPTREDRELRYTVTAWVEQPFDIACTNLLFDLSSEFSSNEPLLAMLRLWRKSFVVLGEITKATILHRDISFQNIRVNETNELVACDFDLAIELNNAASGLRDRTGTIQFMAREILDGKPNEPFHDCESVYWLCAMALLQKRARGYLMAPVETIAYSQQTIQAVHLAKSYFILHMLSCRGLEADDQAITSTVQLNSPVEKDLFKCLVSLSIYFHYHSYPKQGPRANCFEDCSAIVHEHIGRAKSKGGEEPPKKRLKQ